MQTIQISALMSVSFQRDRKMKLSTTQILQQINDVNAKIQALGSVLIEAAIRVLLVRRCKQAGMHWRHINAAHIAALHAQYRSRNVAKAA